MAILDLSKVKKKADAADGGADGNADTKKDTGATGEDTVPDELPSLSKESSGAAENPADAAANGEKQDGAASADASAAGQQGTSGDDALKPSEVRPDPETVTHGPDELPPLREDPGFPNPASAVSSAASGVSSSSSDTAISGGELPSSSPADPLPRSLGLNTPKQIPQDAGSLYVSQLIGKVAESKDIGWLNKELAPQKILKGMSSTLASQKREVAKSQAHRAILEFMKPIAQLEKEWRELKMNIEQQQRLAQRKEAEIKKLVEGLKILVRQEQQSHQSVDSGMVSGSDARSSSGVASRSRSSRSSHTLKKGTQKRQTRKK